MREKVCYIFGAGSFDKSSIDVQKDDYVIAADGGYNHVKNLNINPDLIIGDFDSIEEIPIHPNVKEHPKKKDDTDMMLAVQTGLELGFKCFVIYGGVGGRLDHTLANIQTIAYISNKGAIAHLVGEGIVITAITDTKYEFNGTESGVVSIFCNGDKAHGVYLKNLKYELTDAVLTSQIPTGVSNEFIGKRSTVSVKDGTLIIMWNANEFSH